MSVMGLYFLFVASVAVWWLWREGVTAAPWLQEGEIPAYSNEAGRPKAARAGLTIFLAVALCLFSLISAAFLIRMDSADWRSPPLPGILWVNTAVLVLASALLQIAASAARQGKLTRMRSAFASGGAASLIFLLGQFWAWREMIAGGYYASENPANAFFFLITGAHALHLIGGLVALARAAARAWRQENVEAVSATVELCAIYWHFLLAVWLLMLVLLVGWANNLGVICRRLLS